MSKTELNTQITLQQVRQAQGGNVEDTITAELSVWACVQDASMALKFSAANVGMKVDRIIHLWRSEFESGYYNRVCINGVCYRIESVGASVNDQFVKLLASMG